jgi:methylated-DNA-[protein]-cysteine S-methyltransferase
MITASTLFYTTFDTAAGWIALMGSPAGLRRVELPVKSRDEVIRRLGAGISRAEKSCTYFQDAVEQLGSYFDGNHVHFTCTLDLDGATDFQHKVWCATGLIPYGETRSYAWVASQIGKPQASRAVGQALGRNPLPVIIPCHRVLSSSGDLGGFTGGLEMKKFLLDLERKSGS